MNTVALIEQGAEDMRLPLPPGGAERLARFLQLLEKWNRSHNLTAITGAREMVAGHALDSLAGSPWVGGGRVLDVGSGAGLPGIPLAVADPSRSVVLLDSRRKRVQFLLYAKQALDLDNVTVVYSRIEKYQPPTNFDTLTARAFAALPGLIERLMPFVSSGARLVVWRGRDPAAELVRTLAGRPVCHAVHAVRVPGLQGARHLVVIDGDRTGPPAISGT